MADHLPRRWKLPDAPEGVVDRVECDRNQLSERLVGDGHASFDAAELNSKVGEDLPRRGSAFDGYTKAASRVPVPGRAEVDRDPFDEGIQLRVRRRRPDRRVLRWCH